MILRLLLRQALLLRLVFSVEAALRRGIPGEWKLDKLPDSGEQWQSLPNGVEFQPGANLSPLAQNHLRRLLHSQEYSNTNIRRVQEDDRDDGPDDEEDRDDGTNGPTGSPTHYMAYQYGNGDNTDDDKYRFSDTELFNSKYANNADETTAEFDVGFSKIYMDGSETYYDEYSQAWRALGFYIDCNSQIYDQYYEGGDDDEKEEGDNQQHRQLPENEDNVDNDRLGCQRFMLWAAYIDENYSGNGVHEYKYYDRKSQKWSDAACKAGHSTRCVKQDCHLPDTHFTLLGFFKEPNYDEWMEQLFKHEGDCVWTDTEYQFMQQDREAWPTGCTETIFQDHNNNTIYFDVKPASFGRMDIGLYIDDKCIHDYTDKAYDASTILKSMFCGGYLSNNDDEEDDWNGDDRDDGDANQWVKYIKAYNKLKYRCDVCGDDACDTLASDFDSTKVANYRAWLNSTTDDDRVDYNPNDLRVKNSAWTLESELDQWNDAFDVFKQCLPCKAVALADIVAGLGYKANADGSRYNKGAGSGRRRRRQLNQNGGNANNYDSEFRCHDEANYTNVNQCMKFATHTRMIVASWKDVENAAMQGTLTGVALNQREARKNGQSGYHVIVVSSLTRAQTINRVIWAWIGLIASILLFVVSLRYLRIAVIYRDYYERKGKKLKSPLLVDHIPKEAGESKRRRKKSTQRTATDGKETGTNDEARPRRGFWKKRNTK